MQLAKFVPILKIKITKYLLNFVHSLKTEESLKRIILDHLLLLKNKRKNLNQRKKKRIRENGRNEL